MAGERVESEQDKGSENILESWASGEKIDFVNPEAQKAYHERTARILDAIQLRRPDRVPFWFQDHCYFPCTYTGITFEEAVHNPEIWFAKNKETFLAFEPDMFFNPGASIMTSGQAYESLDTNNMKWPGHGVPSGSSHQYVEGEYMKEDEYDAFIDDFSDFIIRTWLPRVFGTLKPLATLPPLYAMGFGLPGIAEVFTRPEILQAFKSIYRAGEEALKWNIAAGKFVKEMQGLGFPLLMGGMGLAPFDYISDFFRGMRGAMLDMYRRPEKLLKAMDMLLPKIIDDALAGPRMTGNPGVFITLHRVSDAFMSLEQFETFYWPYFKKLILTLIDEGLVPCPFLEGNFTKRLKYFAELPKGKILALMDSTDIYKAKEIIGDNICMSGMMPVSLLQVGSPEKVKDYSRELIDIVGKDGGFIMGPRSVMDSANPGLVKVWEEYTKEYGVYK